MELFRQLLEKWHAAEYAHPSQNPYSVHKPVYQASLLSITESLVIPTRMPLSGISTRDHMMLKHIFENRISFSSVIDVTAAYEW